MVCCLVLSNVDTSQQKTWLGYLAFVRILVGVQFLMVGWPKLAGGRFLRGNGQGLAEELLRGAPKDYLGWHRAFITGFVVPHAHFFSYLVAFGEVAIAAGSATMNYDRLLVLLHIVFVCASAGRVFGLDGLLKKRFPRSWLF